MTDGTTKTDDPVEKSMLVSRFDHPLRRRLTAELHARPYEHIDGPCNAVHFALLSEPRDKSDYERIANLCRDYGVAPPAEGSDHFRAEFGSLRIKWERHTEFSTYTFFAPNNDEEPFATPPATLVPAHWLDKLDKQVLVAKYVVFKECDDGLPDIAEVAPYFASSYIAGCKVSGGAAALWTDFHIQNDGFSRVLVYDCGLRARQRGRLMQRIMEIETYRMMALLAYPLAREYGPALAEIDAQLAGLAERVSHLTVGENEQPLHSELQGLAARLERIGAATNYRFNAAEAYYELVGRRIDELREERIPGLSTIAEFVDRRMAPGVRTCLSVRDLVANLSNRTARLSDLLRTQIDIALETQNRDLLESMDRRAKMQLRLQETVEGLSVVVLSYYSVGLLSLLLKGIRAAGVDLDVEIWTGVAIPFAVLAVWGGVRIMRRKIMAHSGE